MLTAIVNAELMAYFTRPKLHSKTALQKAVWILGRGLGILSVASNLCKDDGFPRCDSA